MTRLHILLAALVVGLIATACFPENVPDPTTGEIKSCYTQKGELRVIDAHAGACTSDERPLTWNQQGVPGTPGQPGPMGSPGLSGYHYVVDEVADTAVEIRANAVCPSGERVIGGGATSSTFFVLQESVPEFVEQGWDQDRWHAKVTSRDGTVQEGRVFAYAICAVVDAS
jgi:hypothetical protein